MRLKGGYKRGFTLIEVMVAIVLIGIGLTALSSGLGAMTASFRRSVEREDAERLAQDKYEEMVAIGEFVDPTEGTFEDGRYQGTTWNLESEPTSIDGVYYVRVSVVMAQSERTALAEGLVYAPPTDSVAP